MNRVLNRYGYWFLFVISTILIVYKCHIGMAWWDESFYFTVPYRLIQGDSLLVQEWHLSQLSAVLLYPWIKTYYAITHTMDGIILVGRYVCVCVEAMVSIFLYLRLRKWNTIAAMICAITFYLYIPYGIMQLSYNSMGIIFMALSVVIVTTMETRVRLQAFLSGVCFACAVLCCPLLVMAYVFAWIYFFTQRNKADHILWMDKRNFLFWNLGIFAMAGIFFVFLLSRSAISQIIACIPLMLSDPEHNLHYTVFDYIKQYFSFIIFQNRWTPPIYLAYTIVCVGICLDKKRYEHRKVHALLVIACIGILFTQILFPNFQSNYVMFPFSLAGFPFYMLYHKENKQLRTLMYGMWVPGLFYSFGITVTSNLAFAAIASVSSIMGMAGICMIWVTLVPEIKDHWLYKFTFLGNILCCCFFVLILFALRYRVVTWEGGPWIPRYEIEDGCQKGLSVPDFAYKEYYGYREATTELREKGPEDKILYISSRTWLYLDSVARNASYTAWFLSTDMLYDYYDINPDQKPSIVFVDKDGKNADKVDELCVYFGYTAIENEYGYILKK